MPETTPTTREQQTAAAAFLAAAQRGQKRYGFPNNDWNALDLARSIVVNAPRLHSDEIAGAAAFLELAHADPTTARELIR